MNSGMGRDNKGHKDSTHGHMQGWMARHMVLTGVILALLCAACLCLVFYFTVFSDFSGSADFVYNHF